MQIRLQKWLGRICSVLLLMLLFESCGASRGYPESGSARVQRRASSQDEGNNQPQDKGDNQPQNKGNNKPQDTENKQPDTNVPATPSSDPRLPVNNTPATQPARDGAPGIGFVEYGLTAYYNDNLHGVLTASGEVYDKNAMTASHKTLPFGAICDITNTRNGKTVRIKINDRCGHPDRILDLSRAAAEKLDFIQVGVVPIKLEIVGFE